MKEYTLIKQGTILPEDFLIDGIINREKYIVEFGFADSQKWYDEFMTSVDAEIIGAIVIGSNLYNDFRFRQRTKEDEKWELSKTLIGKIITAGRKCKK